MNENCPKHLRNAWLTACSALLLAVAGCGGDGSRTENGPRIDGAAATQLADRADEVATLIDDGDVCGAARRADELLAAAQAEVASGTVPPELAEELTANAEKLVNEVNCEQPPPPPPDEDEDEENGKGNGKGKGKGRKDDDD